MAIPGFQTIMLPVLKLASDGHEHRLSEVIKSLADDFELTADERDELLASGRQSKFANRVGWAKTYLTKAGLLDSFQRGAFRITDRGRHVVEGAPARIDIAFLRQFPEFKEFLSAPTSGEGKDEQAAPLAQTPEELLELGYRELRITLARELLDRVKSNSSEYFEKLVVDLLLAMGYGGSRPDAGKAIGKSHDGGVDGLINEDALGLDVVYIQAKRWDNVVGRPLVQAFAGSLDGHHARKGVMITTSSFTGEAKAYAKTIEKRIVLIDGERLADLMIEHGVGVSDVATYSIKKVNLDYFDEQ